MAYSDYGAFVYKDGKRRPDKEDAPTFGDESILAFGNGQRIYAEIASEMAGGKAPEPWESIHHGILGDGNVRVALHKTGVWGACIYVLDEKSGDIREYAEQDIRRMCGVVPDSYPAWRPNMPAEEEREYEKTRDAYWAATDRGYDWSFEVCGAEVRFDWQPQDDGGKGLWAESADVFRGGYHASLVEEDGSRWDAWYGSCYGAGWSDVDAIGRYDAGFDELGDDGKPAEYKLFKVCSKRIEADDFDFEVIYDAAGHVMAASAIETVCDGEGDDVNPAWSRSTLSPSSFSTGYVDAETFAKILNMGIALAHRGYAGVEAERYCRVGDDEAYRQAYKEAFPTEADEERFFEREGIERGRPESLEMAKGIVSHGFMFSPFAALNAEG